MPNEILDALTILARETSVDPTILQHSVETAILAAYRRHFGKGLAARAALDLSTGTFHVWAQKTVADPVADPRHELSLAEAQTLSPSVALGDTIEFEITPPEFARIAIHTAKQVFQQQVRSAQHAQQTAQYTALVGSCVTGRLLHLDHGRWILDLDTVQGILNSHEQIPTESLRPGQPLKCYVTAVRPTARGPQIFVSRRHPALILKLLALEVPEVATGLVRVDRIAREPGVRTKLAVSTDSLFLDPVGACIGPEGRRIHGVLTEFPRERIDILPWAEDPAQAIAAALTPSHVVSVTLDPSTHTAKALVPAAELSAAIGVRGLNARLVSRLTGWSVTVEAVADSPLQRLTLAALSS